MSIDGVVDPRFEPVAAAFAEIIAAGEGTGSAVAVWHDGAWVVDLWGGYADAARTRRWAADSIAMPYSVTKPFAAMTAVLLADRGRIDLDAPLATYWPAMRAPATMRHVLTHASGHAALDRDLPTEAFYDWDLVCGSLAAQEPNWAPGTAIGESALFYGHLIGEVVRRVDGRTLGRFLRDEICGPLGLDFMIGLTDVEMPRAVELTGFGPDLRRDDADTTELYRRAIGNPPGLVDPAVVNGRAWRTAEVPAVNGHGTARAIAGFYVALHEGRLLSPAMLAAATAPSASGVDLVMGDERAWGFGFVVDDDGFGMGGLGGSLGWWSEVGGYAFGFVTGDVAGYDRSERLENAVRACLGLPPVAG